MDEIEYRLLERLVGAAERICVQLEKLNEEKVVGQLLCEGPCDHTMSHGRL